MTLHAFKEEQTAIDLKELAERFRGSRDRDLVEFPQKPQFHKSLSGILWVEVPSGGIPARTGTHPGKPGMAEDCEVWYSEDATDDPIQLSDTDGDPLKVDVYHYGPKAIEELDADSNPRMIMVAWMGGRLVPIVDYCP